jgi:hypothetical protein
VDPQKGTQVRWLSALLLSGSLWGAPPARAVEGEAAIRALLKARLKGRGDVIERTVERIGDKTLKLESVVSLEADFERLKPIASDVASYHEWLLNKINDKPDGGVYPVRLTKLDPLATDPYGVLMEMKLHFPLIKKTLQRTMRFVPETKAQSLVLDADMPDKDDTMLSSGRAKLHFFPAEGEAGRVWVYIEGKIKIKNWLLYEALPTRILKREAGERFQQVIDNYQAEEIRRIKSSQIPTRKTAAQGE